MDRMNVILTSLMAEKLQAWVYIDEGRIVGVVVTSVAFDEVSASSNLLIYSMYGYKPLSEKIINESYLTLSRYARNRDCKRIIAYTQDVKVLEMATRLNGSTHFTLVMLPILEG